MCLSTPSISSPKVEAPISTVQMTAQLRHVTTTDSGVSVLCRDCKPCRAGLCKALKLAQGKSSWGHDMDVKELRKNADIRFAQMMADRLEYEPYWRKLARQFAPNRGRFSVDEKPVKEALRFNSKARQIPDDFAAGLKSGLTSPSRPWFTLTLYDTGMSELEDVKAWLTEVQDIMQGVMLRTNLYDQIYDVYKEQGIFGTGALLIEEDDEKIFHAQSLTIGSYAIGVDKRGKVNRFARQFQRTLRQLADEFGESTLPQELRYRLKDKPDNTRYELRNLIQPSEDYLQSEGKAGQFRYLSLWWLTGHRDP